MPGCVLFKRRIRGQTISVVQTPDGKWTPGGGGGKYDTREAAEAAQRKLLRDADREASERDAAHRANRERIEAKYVECSVCNKRVPNRETHERSADHRNNVAIRDARIRGERI